LDPVAAYWTKVGVGVLVFLVWVLSFTTFPGQAAPFIALTATLQQALFVIAAALLGWSTVQGATAVKSDYLNGL